MEVAVVNDRRFEWRDDIVSILAMGNHGCVGSWRVWYERLARGNAERARRHRAFVEDPPPAAPDRHSKGERAPINEG